MGRIWMAALTGLGVFTESNRPKETRLLGIEWVTALAEKVVRESESLLRTRCQ
jgi:hypothetical protein